MFRKTPWLILLALTRVQVPASAEDAERYNLVGRITDSGGQALAGAAAIVIVSAVGGPFSAEAVPGQDGLFIFSDLEPGLYSVVAAAPRTPETRKTVEIGPRSADPQRRVELELRLKRPGGATHTVSVEELSVPPGALSEHAKSRTRLIKRDVDGAVACLKRAVALAPWFAAAWNDLGTIAYQSHDYEEAETCFREALKQEPRSYSPLVNLGTVLLSEGKTKESLAVNMRAVMENPGDPMAHAQLGMSYLRARNEEMAREHLERAKELDPAHFSYPQLALAQIHAHKKEYAAAVEEYEDFLQRHPDSRLVPLVRTRLEKARNQLRP